MSCEQKIALRTQKLFLSLLIAGSQPTYNYSAHLIEERPPAVVAVGVVEAAEVVGGVDWKILSPGQPKAIIIFLVLFVTNCTKNFH